VTQKPSPTSQDSNTPLVGVVIVAAGSSQRMMGLDKVFEPLLGKPLIVHTVSVFERCPQVDEIVLVLSSYNLERGRSLAAREGWTKLKQVCPGGSRRQDSVKAGLQHLSHCQWIMVHDGARPCVTQELINLGLDQAQVTGAAIPAIAVNDTIKKVHPEGIVQETLLRESLRATQTPQVFRYNLLREAYQGDSEGANDDASLVERLGHTVNTFSGSPENIKVTTQVDLRLAEVILRSRTNL
jgi:2-C-methyl-D-erythritol 4-phosphate cytidylyltransferase